MLILASSSPRRRHLLNSLGIRFLVAPSHVEERPPTEADIPADYARELALDKVEEVSLRCPKDTILAADTVVTVDGQILGKPRDEADALRMLRLLRGREHHVSTAVAIRCGSHEYSGHITSCVRMREFSDDEARRYAAIGEPMDKAGAYAVQEFGGSFVNAVEGCYNAVVGLPLCLVTELLRRCGLGARLPDGSSCTVCGTHVR